MRHSQQTFRGQYHLEFQSGTGTHCTPFKDNDRRLLQFFIFPVSNENNHEYSRYTRGRIQPDPSVFVLDPSITLQYDYLTSWSVKILFQMELSQVMGLPPIIIYFIFGLTIVKHSKPSSWGTPIYGNAPNMTLSPMKIERSHHRSTHGPTRIAQRPKSTRNRNPSLRSIMLSSWLSSVNDAKCDMRNAKHHLSGIGQWTVQPWISCDQFLVFL